MNNDKLDVHQSNSVAYWLRAAVAALEVLGREHSRVGPGTAWGLELGSVVPACNLDKIYSNVVIGICVIFYDTMKYTTDITYWDDDTSVDKCQFHGNYSH